jgi:hypothetical protein
VLGKVPRDSLSCSVRVATLMLSPRRRPVTTTAVPSLTPDVDDGPLALWPSILTPSRLMTWKRPQWRVHGFVDAVGSAKGSSASAVAICVHSCTPSAERKICPLARTRSLSRTTRWRNDPLTVGVDERPSGVVISLSPLGCRALAQAPAAAPTATAATIASRRVVSRSSVSVGIVSISRKCVDRWWPRVAWSDRIESAVLMLYDAQCQADPSRSHKGRVRMPARFLALVPDSPGEYNTPQGLLRNSSGRQRLVSPITGGDHRA